MGEQDVDSPVPFSVNPRPALLEAKLDAVTSPPKPGFTTSEFALKVLAFVLTTLLATGWLPTNSTVAQLVAMASTMVGSIIYTWSRTSVKNASQEGAQ